MCGASVKPNVISSMRVSHNHVVVGMVEREVVVMLVTPTKAQKEERRRTTSTPARTLSAIEHPARTVRRPVPTMTPHRLCADLLGARLPKL